MSDRNLDPVETLQRAAAKLRVVANNSRLTLGGQMSVHSTYSDNGWPFYIRNQYVDVARGLGRNDADYIVTMRPAVAVAVAQLLDNAANGLTSNIENDGITDEEVQTFFGDDLVLARAVLGES